MFRLKQFCSICQKAVVHRFTLMQRLNTLIVEDDPIFVEKIQRELWSSLAFATARTVKQALPKIRAGGLELVLLDKNLPDGKGPSLISEIKAHNPACAILILTSDRLDDSIANDLAVGATDYLHKTEHIASDLLGRILVARSRISLERRCIKAERAAEEVLKSEIIGTSDQVKELQNLIGTLGASDVSVLVLGETGTGKELVARALNRARGDKARPFVVLNCGAIPATLAESELFGHSKGAFSGAVSDRAGKIEDADGGDLFLDEIGELPLETQAKLLRVLESGEYSRVGTNELRRSSFRIIAATHQGLEEMVERKKFRKDLFYRINGAVIRTPSLRHRIEDLPKLVEHFLLTQEGPRFSLVPNALNYLMGLSWPGNVRELRNAISTAITMAKSRKSSKLEISDFVRLKAKPLKLSEKKLNIAEPALSERDRILEVMERCHGNMTVTSKRLGIGRTSLYRKIKQFGIIVPATREVK